MIQRLVLPAIFLAFASVGPVAAQQSSTDSLDAAAVDSIQAALDPFERARPPAAADSTALRRWADSLAARASRQETKSVEDRQLLKKSLSAYRHLADSSQMASVKHKIGYTYYEKGEYEAALTWYRDALAVQRGTAPSHRSGTLIDIGQILNIQGEYEKALSVFRRALGVSRRAEDRTRIAQVLHQIAMVYRDQGRYEEALENLKKALQINREAGNADKIAGNLAGLGIIHAKQGHYEVALDRFQESLRIHRRLEDRPSVAKDLNDISILYRIQGRYEKALEYLREALQINREVGSPLTVAANLNNIGLVYERQGRYEKARAAFEEALTVNRELENRGRAASNLQNLAMVSQKQGQYEEALDYTREALSINRDIGNRARSASNLRSLGSIYTLQGHYQKAMDHLEQALDISEELGRTPEIAKTHSSIGTVHRHQGHPQEALIHFRKALRLNREMGRRIDVPKNLKNIGKTHLVRRRPDLAVDTLKYAVQLAEELRTNASSAESRRSLLATQINAYRSLTAAYVQTGQSGASLRSVERARARLLADRLAGTATGDTTFTIPPVAELRRTLGPDEAALLYANAGTQWPLTALVVTRDRVVARRLPDSTVRAAIEEKYPTRLNRLRREEGPLTAALGAGRSQTQGTTPSLAETIRLYRYYLTRSTGTSIQKDLAQRLHALLIAPVEEHLQTTSALTVVPTGTLGYLPFETLRDSTGTYLVEDKHIRYAQSLTVLRQLQQRDYGTRKRPLLALGGAAYASDPSSGGGTLIAEARGGSTRVATRGYASTLFQSAERRLEQGKSLLPTYKRLGYRTWSDLPGTKTEANQLGKMSSSKARVITGKSASEETVRSMSRSGALGRYRRVHFATHGIAVPETPALSALVLSQVGTSDSLAARDGYLTMEEIAGLDLNADVAVLSACQTGLGKVVAGEGVVSLSHAFLRAGANATLVSQWKVLDESTRQFMTSVYKKAKADDTSFAEAVTTTKRAFIAGKYGEKNTDPLRWAPFVYYGRE